MKEIIEALCRRSWTDFERIYIRFEEINRFSAKLANSSILINQAVGYKINILITLLLFSRHTT